MLLGAHHAWGATMLLGAGAQDALGPTVLLFLGSAGGLCGADLAAFPWPLSDRASSFFYLPFHFLCFVRLMPPYTFPSAFLSFLYLFPPADGPPCFM